MKLTVQLKMDAKDPELDESLEQGLERTDRLVAKIKDLFETFVREAANEGLLGDGNGEITFFAEEVPYSVSTLRRPEPIPMILLCPNCGNQHVDAPEPENDWTNPPHRSHRCALCGTVWRPADVATVGVERIETRGEKDTWLE